jgi:translation elongation factor EF-1alpha
LEHFPDFNKTLLKKWQVAASRFSKEFSVNLRKASTNRKRGIALSCLQKSFRKADKYL